MSLRRDFLKGISRREFIRYSSAGLLASAFSFGTTFCAPENKRPNFVFFLTDDQRWDGMSCAGNNIIKTPNMDRISQGGFRFTNMFVTTSLCGPSRASILTGKYAHNHGVRRNGMSLSPEQKTFLEILREAANKELTSGRGPTGVAAASLYIATVLCGERRTQRDIADEAGITEVTIRNRYKELAEKLDIEITL